jgi:pimeloyl-ACP methyl ester carboxylesterase
VWVFEIISLIARLAPVVEVSTIAPMSPFRLLLMSFVCSALPAVAAETPRETGPTIATSSVERTDQWHGFTRRKFVCDGCEAWIVEPKTALPGKPWSWCMEFPDAFTERCAAPALLTNGFHHAHISVGNTYGSPGAMKHFEAFHAEAVKRGLAPKAALIGISRGCLYAHRFAAEHPDKVSVIYGDAGVCDIKSWPGGKGKGKGSAADWASLQKFYGFRDEAAALDWKGGPVDTLAPLAKGKIPLIYVVGDSDTVVPAAENTLIVEQRYKAFGVVRVIHKPGVDHHPHGLDDPTPVVNFIIEAAKVK